MTQEERQLLLKDLCARLPYGVIGLYTWKCNKSYNRELTGNLYDELQLSLGYPEGDSEFLPYLRPISSMTDGEIDKLFDILNINEDNETEWLKVNDIGIIRLFTQEGKEFYEIAEAIDYLYSIHVDFRGLLKKGLAIEVTEENNTYK